MLDTRKRISFGPWVLLFCLASSRMATAEEAEAPAGPDLHVEYGSSRPILDRAGWVLGVPRKILLWDSRADNHQVSEETVWRVAEYLSDQQLCDVKVRVNQYAPRDEWRRLVANPHVAPGWKYTVGVLKHVEYTLFPGRLFGGDAYNPFTNSLYVYSDAPALPLAESAYAKDVRSRQQPGTYATAQMLPIVAMWHETLATREVLSYVALRGTPEEQQETRRLLYARYGMELGGEVGSLLGAGGVQLGNVYQVVGAVGGHAAATIVNN